LASGLPRALRQGGYLEVEFVCVVAKESPSNALLRLKQYLAADHIRIDIVGGIQTILEKRLSAIGAKRHCPMFVPYHTTAMRSLVGTDLVATVPRRIAELEASDPSVRIVKTPAVLGTFKYLIGLAPSNEYRCSAHLVAVNHP
jgi:hypothetical protein